MSISEFQQSMREYTALRLQQSAAAVREAFPYERLEALQAEALRIRLALLRPIVALHAAAGGLDLTPTLDADVRRVTDPRFHVQSGDSLLIARAFSQALHHPQGTTPAQRARVRAIAGVGLSLSSHIGDIEAAMYLLDSESLAAALVDA